MIHSHDELVNDLLWLRDTDPVKWCGPHHMDDHVIVRTLNESNDKISNSQIHDV